MYWISEPFLYLGFAILAGITVLSLAPESKKPVIKFPVWLGPAAAVIVALCAFIPILQIILFFKEDVGLSQSFKAVMFSFKEGERYASTAALSFLMAVLTVFIHRRPSAFIRWLMPLALLGISFAMSSFNHAASLFGVKGELAFFGHFTSMAVWTGTLLIVGWFSKGSKGWGAFLKWFHPLAILSVTIVIGSGLFLMSGVTPDLVNSWIVPYGQALLIKHILIIPLLFFAFINGYLAKRKLALNPRFNPAVWSRYEGVILWLIYIVTGYMNQQSAPHDISVVLSAADAADTFLWFHAAFDGMPLRFTWSLPGIMFLLIGAGLLLRMVTVFRRNRRAAEALLCGLLAAAAIYTGIMFSFQ
ncbi:copper resistance D family protein [Paenibacillus dakarensis]|uniref:copper resistance D family protein n=1 Tax=Paenibacillus dakarensis TaxID=1527293 RepID=UPI0006D58CD4|nr:CopD family protein [Paenibacillus dakarensis]